MAGAGGHDVNLYQWQNGTWLKPAFSFFPNFNSYATSFAVAENNTIWVGYNFRGWPYARFDAGILTTDAEIHFKNFWKPVPVAAMLADSSRVWAVGPHWLLTPDYTVRDLVDSPVLPNISDVILYNQRELWLGSYDVQPEPYSRGELQVLRDQGTSTMNDDIWVQQPHVDGYDEVLYTWGRTPDGDLLSSWGMKGRVGYWLSYSLRRYRQGDVFEIPGPYSASINDIFAQDNRHIWFASSYEHFDPTQFHRVLALDDGGTPSDFADDIWQNYPITSTGTGDTVAVDTLGRLWYGNSENLFLFSNGEWQPFFNHKRDVCDLTVDGKGSLYMLSWFEGHCSPTNLITTISPDNAEQQYYSSSLIAERYFSLRTTPYRNKLWTVAPDGAIWYLIQRYSDAPSYSRSDFLERYDGSEVTAYPLPFTPQTALQLEVDAYNNVWFLHDNQVWRMSQPPGFVLAAQPLNWQVEPGLVYSGDIMLHSRDGYSGTLTLSALTPSDAIRVTVAPDHIAIGQSAKFTFTVAADSQPSAFAVKLVASDAVLTQTTILSVTLRETGQNVYLPMVAR